MAAGVISSWNLTPTAKLKSISTAATTSNSHLIQGRSCGKNIVCLGSPLATSFGAKTWTNSVRWRKTASAADSSKSSAEPSTSESSNAKTAATNDQIASSSSSSSSSNVQQLDANGGLPSATSLEEAAAPRRSSLTVREKLRAARVLSKYMDSKPSATKGEFGRRVLEASRESDKGRKRSGLPEAPTNLFDDSKRGLPQPGWTFELPFQGDLFAIIFSFVFISTVMFATTFLVWKSGAIHFNEY